MKIKNTPLFEKHRALNAKMVPFAGWNMPVQYSEGIIAEHNHTRNKVSLFDICHMGELRIKGTGAAEALEQIFPRSVISQTTGSCRYNFLLSDTGTVIDDLIIYRMDQDEFLIVVNAGTKDSDLIRLRELIPESIEIVDESACTAKLDLQGPESANTLEELGLTKEELPKYYKWINTSIAGVPVLLSRTGYTGELGFELYFNADFSEKIWDLLLDQSDVKPAGLGARDTLRLEMGYPLYGHEMDIETTPIEAGFKGMLNLEDNRNFPGAEDLKNIPVKKQLTGIVLEGRRAAREGTEIMIDGQIVGKVSSGAFSPSLGKAIAMGYFNSEVKITPETQVELAVGRGTIPGKIASMPFYRDSTVRIKL
jgi:aminomethyltransferase